MIFGTIEWTMPWLKHTHINTNKKQWVSNLQALHNDTALFHSVHKLFVLALVLWGVVMLCCFAHIFSTGSPLSILTQLITILISATPHSVYSHSLPSTLSFCFRLFLKQRRLECIVWSLIWQPVTPQDALLPEFARVKTFRKSSKAF